MFRIIAALALACVLSACQTAQTTSTGWGQIAAGVGAVLGETRIDPQIERISSKLAAYCVQAQTAALGIDLLAPPKVQRAAQEARIVVETFCTSPPRNVASAIASVAAANAAIVQARAATGA